MCCFVYGDDGEVDHLPALASGDGHGDRPAEDLSGDGLAVDTVATNSEGETLRVWVGCDSDNLGGGHGDWSWAAGGGGCWGWAWVALSVLADTEATPVRNRGCGSGWGRTAAALGCGSGHNCGSCGRVMRMLGFGGG